MIFFCDCQPIQQRVICPLKLCKTMHNIEDLVQQASVHPIDLTLSTNGPYDEKVCMESFLRELTYPIMSNLPFLNYFYLSNILKTLCS